MCGPWIFLVNMPTSRSYFGLFFTTLNNNKGIHNEIKLFLIDCLHDLIGTKQNGLVFEARKGRISIDKIGENLA